MITETQKQRKLDIKDYFCSREPQVEDYDKLSLIQILNYYANNLSAMDQKELVIKYLKNDKSLDTEIIEGLDSLHESWFGNLGGKFKLLHREYPFTENQIYLMQLKLNELIDKVKLAQQPKTRKEIPRFDASQYLADIDDVVWDFLHNKIEKYDFHNYFVTNNVNFIYCKKIIEKYSKLLLELKEVINGNEEIAEYYQNLTKKQIIKYHDFVKSIIDDAGKIREKASSERKPRKIKKKDPKKIVDKVKYCAYNEHINLKSIHPIEILNSKILIVYDHQYRKIQIYYADESIKEGLSVKGTTIINFDENKSVGKILRKPEIYLEKFKSATKAQIKVLLKELSTGELKLTGRLSENNILMRAYK